jgi:serine/threonine protein kinase
MLKRFEHPYVVKLKNVSTNLSVKIPKTKEHRHEDSTMRIDGLYMFFELGDYDLESETLKNTKDTLRAHAQVLLALEYMHRHNHIHRDIKPANMLVFEDTKTCKLIDFGMCKPMYPGVKSNIHAVTAAYRPPEMFLGTRTYGPEVDIWALGTTLIYCLLKKEVDVSGSTPTQTVLTMMLELYPLEDLTPDQAKRICPGHGGRASWASLLENFQSVPGLQDLLSHMLCWQPKSRWTATQCLNHPVFDEFRDMIEGCRKKTDTPPPSLAPYTIHIERSPERDLMIDQCRASDLLEPRVLFHAMDYIDRYIAWRVAQQLPRPDHAVSVLRARVCLYLAFKYFNIMTENMPIDKMWRGINKTEAGEFEKTLVRDIFNYHIYRPTLFELTGGGTKALKEVEERYRKGEGLEGYVVSMPCMYTTHT